MLLFCVVFASEIALRHLCLAEVSRTARREYTTSSEYTKSFIDLTRKH